MFVVGAPRYARRRLPWRARGPRWAGCSRSATSLACWISSSVERQKSRPPGAFLIVNGILSSAAMRRRRFFIVVGLVPSGSVRRAAVLSSD
jgi:hypothetical protein